MNHRLWTLFTSLLVLALVIAAFRLIVYNPKPPSPEEERRRSLTEQLLRAMEPGDIIRSDNKLLLVRRVEIETGSFLFQEGGACGPVGRRFFRELAQHPLIIYPRALVRDWATAAQELLGVKPAGQ